MKPKFFKSHELLPPDVYNSLSEDARWLLFDDRLLWTADELRKLFGAATCNTWKNGGNLTLRGFRPPTSGVGAKYSQHQFGRALDMNFANATPEEIRADMKKNPNREAYKYIRGVEEDVSWLHFDVRNRDSILFFKP